MKKTHIYLFLSLLTGGFVSCSSDIKNGTTDIDNWPEVNEYKMIHPCMLHTATDFALVKQKVAEGVSPWKEGYDVLAASSNAQSSYVASPVEILKRLDQTNWQATYPDFNNYTNAMYDAAAAYQLALRWQVTRDDQFARAGVAILNAWATKCKGILTKNGSFIDPNEYLISIQTHQFANAAEALRDYTGWAATDFKKFQTWIADVFYPKASLFLGTHPGHSDCPLYTWANWDLAQMTAILSIGILNEDQNKINEAIQYFKYGKGAGAIDNAVPYLHTDKDTGVLLGQGQESGRDQGHATLCITLMGAFCQMAYNIGEDLFAYDNNKILAMAEYTAKYNVKKTGAAANSNADEDFLYTKVSFPYTPYENCAWNCPALSSKELDAGKGETSRGSERPGWELIYNHYAKVKSLPVKYSHEFANKMRPEGGGGNYGPNSGGYDQLGFGTLMFTK